jgi:hypothetical protein
MHLCAYGLQAWALVHAGGKLPGNFGEVMVLVSSRLNILGTAESFSEHADKLLQFHISNSTIDGSELY